MKGGKEEDSIGTAEAIKADHKSQTSRDLATALPVHSRTLSVS